MASSRQEGGPPRLDVDTAGSDPDLSRDDNVVAITRTADVLSLFARSERRSLGVSEIARALGLSKAVVFRILSSIRPRGFIEVDPDTRRYALGPEALLLGFAFLENVDARRLARSTLLQLSAATGETAALALRVGWERVYVDQVTPERDIKMVVPIGKRFPLHAGSSSKAFLAFLDNRELERFFRQSTLTKLTPSTISDPAKLRDDLARIRRQGYATSFGERHAGSASVAVPILDEEGRPTAVLTVCGPADRFGKGIDAAAQLLIEAGHGLSRRLGYLGSSRSPTF